MACVASSTPSKVTSAKPARLELPTEAPVGRGATSPVSEFALSECSTQSPKSRGEGKDVYVHRPYTSEIGWDPATSEGWGASSTNSLDSLSSRRSVVTSSSNTPNSPTDPEGSDPSLPDDNPGLVLPAGFPSFSERALQRRHSAMAQSITVYSAFGLYAPYVPFFATDPYGGLAEAAAAGQATRSPPGHPETTTPIKGCPPSSPSPEPAGAPLRPPARRPLPIQRPLGGRRLRSCSAVTTDLRASLKALILGGPHAHSALASSVSVAMPLGGASTRAAGSTYRLVGKVPGKLMAMDLVIGVKPRA